MSYDPTAPFPFTVPLHDRMLARVPGKVAGTVLTVEMQIYTFRICEYTEWLSYGRHWCYEDGGKALGALLDYLADDVATEPLGWVKATTFEDGYTVRRAKRVNGQIVIVVDEDD